MKDLIKTRKYLKKIIMKCFMKERKRVVTKSIMKTRKYTEKRIVKALLKGKIPGAGSDMD